MREAKARPGVARTGFAKLMQSTRYFALLTDAPRGWSSPLAARLTSDRRAQLIARVGVDLSGAASRHDTISAAATKSCSGLASPAVNIS